MTGEGLVPGAVSLTVQVLDNGLPRLGTTRTFQVRILDRNAAPVLAPIADRTLNEGRLLEFIASATDSDLPRQRLTYRLGGPVPAGMSLHPDSGVFQWRPTDVQGGTTNRITIVVTDDGVPPLSARQSFQLVVRDTRSDFALQLGTTNLLSGATRSIPITLRSQASLTNLSFVVDSRSAASASSPSSRCVPQLATLSTFPEGTHQVRIQLGARRQVRSYPGKPIWRGCGSRPIAKPGPRSCHSASRK